MIKCKNCNKEFKQKNKNHIFCSKGCKIKYSSYSDNNVCEVCGENFHGPKGKKYCSSECRALSVREERVCKLCGEKFIERIKHKREFCSNECRLTWGERDDIKQKRLDSIKKTVMDKYGVEHVWSIPEIHKKTIENTDKQKSIIKQQKTVRDKHIKKLEKKLEINSLKLLDDYTTNKDGSTSKHYTYKCTKCDNVFTSTLLGCGVIPVCRVCNPITKNSKMELDVEKFLNDNSIKYIKNDRKLIQPKELDFYLPDFDIALELNGVYWHSERNGKDKNYHIDKTIMCQDKGVKLIHIFSDEFNNKTDIVFSMLNNQLNLNVNKIPARKCVINEIDSKTKKTFLNQNHIQGDTKSSINLGMFYDNTLVSVITLGKRKINRSKSINWEIIRFSTTLNTTIMGGFSKFISYIKKNKICTNLHTYADIRWSGLDVDKVVYSKSGFKYLGITKPSYWYVKDGYDLREHRFNYRKDVLVKQGYDPQKTEYEIMLENNYNRVWDCGNLKYEIVLV